MYKIIIKNILNFLVKIVIQKFICKIWCIFKTKEFIYLSSKRKRTESQNFNNKQIISYLSPFEDRRGIGVNWAHQFHVFMNHESFLHWISSKISSNSWRTCRWEQLLIGCRKKHKRSVGVKPHLLICLSVVCMYVFVHCQRPTVLQGSGWYRWMRNRATWKMTKKLGKWLKFTPKIS